VPTKAQSLQQLLDFPNEAADITRLADERCRRCLQAKEDAKTLLRSKAKHVEDSLEDLYVDRPVTHV
jgi:hypothetical protein